MARPHESLPTADLLPDNHALDSFTEDVPSDAVYCICRQPFNDTFMIACDVCNEWYHGDCVGMTEDEGRLLEDEQYVCPFCRNRLAEDDGSFPRPDRSADSLDLIRFYSYSKSLLDSKEDAIKKRRLAKILEKKAQSNVCLSFRRHSILGK